MKKNETIADIVAEMRGMGNYQRYSGDHAHALADRIEAAWKRDRESIYAMLDNSITKQRITENGEHQRDYT